MTADEKMVIDLLNFAQETGDELRLIESGKLVIIRNGRSCCHERMEELRIRQRKIANYMHKILNECPKAATRS